MILIDHEGIVADGDTQEEEDLVEPLIGDQQEKLEHTQEAEDGATICQTGSKGHAAGSAVGKAHQRQERGHGIT